MSNDATPIRLAKFGTVTVSPDGAIAVEGFEAEGGSCRDVAILASQWAIGRLHRELTKTIETLGGGNISVD